MDQKKTEIVILHISAFCSEVCLDLCSNKKSTKNKVILVGGFNPSEKYGKSVGMIIPNTWKIKFMFRTTNQYTNTIEHSNPQHCAHSIAFPSLTQYTSQHSNLAPAPRFSECDLRIILKRPRIAGNPWDPWASHLPQKNRYTGVHNPHKPMVSMHWMCNYMSRKLKCNTQRYTESYLHNAQFEDGGAATAHGYASSWKTNLAKLEAYASILWQKAWELGDSKTKCMLKLVTALRISSNYVPVSEMHVSKCEIVSFMCVFLYPKCTCFSKRMHMHVIIPNNNWTG